MTDPRILFDDLGKRWYLSYLLVNTGPTGGSQVILAASMTSTIGNTAGSWYGYAIATQGSGVFDDQPRLGYSSDKIVVSWNEFQASPPAPACGGASFCYLGVGILVVERSDVDAGATTPRVAAAPVDPNIFSMTAVQELTPTTDVWMVYNNSDSVNGPINGGTPSIGVKRLIGTPATTVTLRPEVEVAIVPTTIPPSATQPGTTAVIDTGDDRLLGAVYRSGHIWTTANDGACGNGFSCGRFVELAVTAGTGMNPDIATLDPNQDWDLAGAGTDFYYPAASFDSFGNMMGSVTQSSPSTFTSVAGLGEWVTAPGALSFLTTLQSSASAYFDPTSPSGPCFMSTTPSPCRWGDYHGAAFDPGATGSVWVVGEYVPTSAAYDWGTFLARLTSAPVFTADTPATTAAPTVPYNYTFLADGNPESTFTVASGSLPAGLNLSTGGVLSGTPTTNGSSTFTVSATNGVTPNAVTPSITITVSPASATRLTARGGDAGAWSKSGSDGASPVFGASWTGWGGSILGAPAVVSAPNNSGPPTPYYIATGLDHNLWVRSELATWRRISPTPVNCTSSPGARVGPAPAGAISLLVACRGGDGALWIASHNIVSDPATLPTMPIGSWSSLGGSIVDGPAVITDDQLLGDIFYATGTDHSVWTRSVTTMSGPGPWTSAGLSCIGHLSATAVVASAVETEAFACQGSDHGVWAVIRTAGVGGATVINVGGSVIDGPGIALTPASITFVVEGGDHGLWQRTAPTSTFAFGSWSALGGVVTNGANAIALLPANASP